MSSFLKIECSLLAQFWAPGVARGGAGLLESGGGGQREIAEGVACAQPRVHCVEPFSRLPSDF